MRFIRWLSFSYHLNIGTPGELGGHATLKGRNAREAITTVTTFTGHAFHPASDVQPLLVLSTNQSGAAPLMRNPPDVQPNEKPTFLVGGWLQGGAVKVGSGRAVVLGEAAMCTPQLVGPQRSPMGMNNPLAPENTQLSGLLDD
jgi:hypothetical protein